MKFVQPNFTAGEISPSLHARVDLDRYRAGLARLENFVPRPTGGVRNRPGWRLAARGYRPNNTLAGIAAAITPYSFVELECPALASTYDDRGRPLFDVTEQMPAPDYGIYRCAINWGGVVNWDALRNQIVWVSSNHYAKGQPHNSKLYRYLADTNTWSAKSDPHNTGEPTSGRGPAGSWKSGHCYAENALDTQRRIAWKYDSGTDQIRGINLDDGTYFGRLYAPSEAIGFGRVLLYLAHADALLMASPGPDGVGSVWIRRTQGATSYLDAQWTKVASNAPFTRWHMVGAYHAGRKEALVGGGAAEGVECRTMYVVDESLVATRLPDAPYALSVSEPGAIAGAEVDSNDPRRSVIVADPRSSKSIVFSGAAGGVVYDFDHVARTWGTTVRATLPFTTKNILACPVHELGVVVVVKWGVANTARMFVYRHE